MTLEDSKPRRTFAIISHPDAGKTTVTEKLLLYSGAIQMAGTVKGRKAARHATSDWMALEKQRGISVTTSVMQFVYEGRVINLLDTPGHADFTEDTYRTLTAVDSALMVIDGAKGVEARTIKLMDVCRLRTTPIMTFVNKFDRESRDPLELLDEIEDVLRIRCAPITWPIGMGATFKGIYHLIDKTVFLYQTGSNQKITDIEVRQMPNLSQAIEWFGDAGEKLVMDIELLEGASHPFNHEEYLKAELSPVFFGSAINNFGLRELLHGFVTYAPGPQEREAEQRLVSPDEKAFSGFVFKVQANMDPSHRDRMAFVRVVSGSYEKGQKLRHVRLGKDFVMSRAQTFMAGSKTQATSICAGDIVGFPNHGTIRIGDTFTVGETLHFKGVPDFAPELFRLVRLKDPLKRKALYKGLRQLSEEGAVQLFRMKMGTDLILGAVGVLQFDVVAYRLEHEYRVQCVYADASVAIARWVTAVESSDLEAFSDQMDRYLGFDGAERLVYLAPSRVNLELTMEEWPRIQFSDIEEHTSGTLD